jgi:hypothetical protein
VNSRATTIEDIVRVRASAFADAACSAIRRGFCVALTRWLGQFKDCSGHRGQRVSLRRHLDVPLSDSPRKSVSAMLTRRCNCRSFASYWRLQRACSRLECSKYATDGEGDIAPYM